MGQKHNWVTKTLKEASLKIEMGWVLQPSRGADTGHLKKQIDQAVKLLDNAYQQLDWASTQAAWLKDAKSQHLLEDFSSDVFNISFRIKRKRF